MSEVVEFKNIRVTTSWSTGRLDAEIAKWKINIKDARPNKTKKLNVVKGFYGNIIKKTGLKFGESIWLQVILKADGFPKYKKVEKPATPGPEFDFSDGEDEDNNDNNNNRNRKRKKDEILEEEEERKEEGRKRKRRKLDNDDDMEDVCNCISLCVDCMYVYIGVPLCKCVCILRTLT